MNSVSEKIDERILRLLGLDDVFDLDYDTYMTLLKEAIVTGSNKLPEEELAILANERKRVRGKKGRFTPKKEKITADKVATTKLLKGTKVSKKTLALSSTISKPDIQQQDLTGIGKPLESISKTLATLLKFSKKTSEEERRDKETQKRTKREEGLEGFKKGISMVSSAAKKMLAPFQSIIDRIWKFIFFTLLGRAFTQLMGWLGDPKNKRKIEVLGRFLKDWWPTLLGAAVLFFTPFGKFVRGTLKIVGFFAGKLVKAIPQIAKAVAGLGRFAVGHPLLTIGLATGLATGAAEMRRQGEEKKQVESEAKKRGVKPETVKIELEQAKRSPFAMFGEAMQNIGGFVSGGSIPSLGNGYSGIDGSTGQKVSGFGPDTQMIVAQPGEVVMNKKAVNAIGADTLLGWNRHYGGPGANKPKMGRMFNTGGMVGNNKAPQFPKISSSDYNTLLAISAIEDDKAQGRADVAQSLYNRLHAASNYGVNFNQTSNSLKDLITAADQFEPTFSNRNDWMNISDRNSAAIAIMNSKKGKKFKWSFKEAMNQLNATEKALKNPRYQAQSQKHVGGRAYFQGTSEQKSMKPGDVLRDPTSNFFSPWYLEGSKYDKERRNIAAPIPSSLLPKQQTKPKAKTKPMGFWETFGSIMPTSLPFFGGGLVKENTGMNISGATADRQSILAQPGEYILPVDTVNRLGVSVIDRLVAMTDSNSNAYLGKGTITRPKITPLRRGQSEMMTLPPITQSASGGSVGGGSAAGSKVPAFSTSSPSGGAERSMNAGIYGIVG
jgi:hypothetical protein